MALILVNVNLWALKKTIKMRYLPTMKSDLKKTATKKLLVITINEHLNFNKHITNVCKSVSRKLNVLLRVSFHLSYQKKKVVSNSFISGPFSYCPLVWMYSSIRSYGKINKLHERSLRLCQ